MRSQKPNKDVEINYTGQTIGAAPETSDAGESGTYYKENYLISSEPPFVVNSLQIVRGEEEKVDEEAIKILEGKNYQAVLTTVA